MKLTLTRLDVTDHGIFGKMEADDGSFSCVTLENHSLDIPAGTYGLNMYTSPEQGYVPILLNVPNRYYIEIHEGNYEFNSKGCILVGDKRDGIAIDDSRATLAKLVQLLKGQKTITLQIV